MAVGESRTTPNTTRNANAVIIATSGDTVAIRRLMPYDLQFMLCYNQRIGVTLDDHRSLVIILQN